MPKRGENLQALVASIERATNRDQTIRVESPKRLRDKTTGNWREHDVVLTFNHAHHTLVVAIECRDRSRKVGVPELEAFKKKCDETGIDQGTIVSSRGFTKSAVTKARRYNIGCLGLNAALGFDWCLARGCLVFARIPLATHIVAIPSREPISATTVIDESGNVIAGERVRNIGRNCLQQLPYDPNEESESERTQRFVVRSPPLFLKDSAGDMIPITRLNVSCRYKTLHKLFPHEYYEYVDGSSGDPLYSLVSAPIEIDSVKGRMTLINKGPEGIIVTWTPEGGLLPSGARSRTGIEVKAKARKRVSRSKP